MLQIESKKRWNLLFIFCYFWLQMVQFSYKFGLNKTMLAPVYLRPIYASMSMCMHDINFVTCPSLQRSKWTLCVSTCSPNTYHFSLQITPATNLDAYFMHRSLSTVHYNILFALLHRICHGFSIYTALHNSSFSSSDQLQWPDENRRGVAPVVDEVFTCRHK